MKVKINKATYSYFEEYHFTEATYGVKVDIPEDLYNKICKATKDYNEAQTILQKLYKGVKNE
jgi:hypothetical protein